MAKSILKKKLSVCDPDREAESLFSDERREFVLSKQILRPGTAMGALIREAEFGQSRADFRNKMYIALKEANETDYWLNLLKDTNFIGEKEFKSISDDCTELIRMLVATFETTAQSARQS